MAEAKRKSIPRSAPGPPAATRKARSETRKDEHRKRKARERLVGRMGIDPEHGWKAQYEILPGKEKVSSRAEKTRRNL